MTGRVERMFQVLPDQEEAMYIGDMFSDGLFVVELSSQSPMTSTDPNPTILLSPDMEQARLVCVCSGCVCVGVQCVCVRCVCVYLFCGQYLSNKALYISRSTQKHKGNLSI